MTKARVETWCWKSGHMDEMVVSRKTEDRLSRKIKKERVVCGSCNSSLFIKVGQTVLPFFKVYKCRHGHVTTIAPLGKNMLHIKYSNDDFTNVDGSTQQLEEMIAKKKISCLHDKNEDKLCKCKLHPVDDFDLVNPDFSNFRTKTRVGDLWDKYDINPVQNGSYDSDGNYHGTKSEYANKERLKKRRKRNISKKKLPGKPL